MLACRMIGRSMPRHTLCRSLASNGPGSKTTLNLTIQKSRHRIASIWDKVSFLDPKCSFRANATNPPNSHSNTPNSKHETRTTKLSSKSEGTKTNLPNETHKSENACSPQETPRRKSHETEQEVASFGKETGQEIVCKSNDTRSCPPKIGVSEPGNKDEDTVDPPKANMDCLAKGLGSEKADFEKTSQTSKEISKIAATDCETSGPSPEEPPTPNTTCPEIARLECLHDPCDTDPEELLLPKEEVLKRRCFKCSTIEENNWIDLSASTGVPEEQLKDRTVTISKAFKNVMQQGTDNTKDWEVQWDTKERWRNPLMGWASTADPLGNVKLSFATQLDAERWCTRNGWKYQILPERKPKTIPPKNYADNFSWNRRHRISTK